LLTFALTVFAWIFFRAESIDHAFSYISGIFSPHFFQLPALFFNQAATHIYILLPVFLIIEWLGREGEYGLQFLLRKPGYIHYTTAYLVALSIALFMSLDIQEFIYFQF